MGTSVLEDEKGSGEGRSHTSYYDETVIWSGSPSQWLNLGTYLFYGLLWAGSLAVVLMWHGYGYDIQYAEYENVYRAVVISLATMPPVIMIWAWLKLRSDKIIITRNKITEASGITAIFRREKYCEMSDVTDIKSPPAGILALVGRSTLVLETLDKDQPIIRIRAMKNREWLRDTLMPLKRQLRVERKTYFADK